MYRISSKKSILNKARNIKLILLDVDGVLTDGNITYGKFNSDEPVEIKTFDVHDGYGIVKAIENEIKVGIITARDSPLVTIRAKELGIEDIYQGSFNKIEQYEKVKKKYSLSDDVIAYMGDDLFDLPLLEVVGLSSAPSSARPEVRRKVDYVTKSSGGKGAVREFIDFILKVQGRFKVE